MDPISFLAGVVVGAAIVIVAVLIYPDPNDGQTDIHVNAASDPLDARVRAEVARAIAHYDERLPSRIAQIRQRSL